MVVRPLKNGIQSDHQPPNTGTVKNLGPATLGSNEFVSTFVFLLRIGSQNRPTITALNIAIIHWCQLVHTVLAIKAGSHFRVQYQMQLCIQSLTGVKNRLSPFQLKQPIFPFHYIQHLALVRQATMRQSLENSIDCYLEFIFGILILFLMYIKHMIRGMFIFSLDPTEIF